MAIVVAWLATFSDGKRKAAHHRVQHRWVNSEAASHPVVRAHLAQYEAQQDFAPGFACNHLIQGHEVVGLVALEPIAQHHSLLDLREQSQAQFDFWSLFSSTPLDGCLYHLNIVRCTQSEHRLSLAETSTGRTTFFSI